jgi:tetratricopeptide (TPR) repeat protein
MRDAAFILRRFPNDPNALQLAMKVALTWPNHEQAAEPHFKKALERFPQYGETWLLYGVYLHRMGDLDEAVDNYRMALERKGPKAEAYYNLGLALFDLGELRKANRAAQEAYDRGFPLPGLRDKLQAEGAWQSEASE